MEAEQTSRMDRVEQNIERLTQSISELRESQKETDKKFRETDNKFIKSLKKSDRIDRQIDRNEKRIDKLLLASEKADRRVDKIARKLDAVGKQLGDMGIVQGEIGEDLFYRNVKYLFQKRGIEFEIITRNLLKKGMAEYDIVAERAGEVLVIEVKNKLTRRMINQFIEKKLPRFKTLFPEYKTYRVSGGVGSLVVKDDNSAYAEKKGLYVLTQRGDGGAMLVNRENFKPKVFD